MIDLLVLSDMPVTIPFAERFDDGSDPVTPGDTDEGGCADYLGGSPAARPASSVALTSKDIFLPATLRTRFSSA